MLFCSVHIQEALISLDFPDTNFFSLSAGVREESI